MAVTVVLSNIQFSLSSIIGMILYLEKYIGEFEFSRLNARI